MKNLKHLQQYDGCSIEKIRIYKGQVKLYVEDMRGISVEVQIPDTESKTFMRGEFVGMIRRKAVNTGLSDIKIGKVDVTYNNEPYCMDRVIFVFAKSEIILNFFSPKNSYVATGLFIDFDHNDGEELC